MRVLIQRVTRAEVTVEAERVGAIERGLLLFVGVTHDDDDAAIDLIAHKVANLRIFPDAADQMNRSALDRASAGDTVGLLVIPQFTLYADTRHGRRPS
ncbi:MAG: D-aminoacyl-tRNA deacylase, partial [Chloroflexota bacterium]|nr:D-aminoacyl-tRNA deacylase [Chloroflexota bacterium]